MVTQEAMAAIKERVFTHNLLSVKSENYSMNAAIVGQYHLTRLSEASLNDFSIPQLLSMLEARQKVDPRDSNIGAFINEDNLMRKTAE